MGRIISRKEFIMGDVLFWPALTLIVCVAAVVFISVVRLHTTSDDPDRIRALQRTFVEMMRGERSWQSSSPKSPQGQAHAHGAGGVGPFGIPYKIVNAAVKIGWYSRWRRRALGPGASRVSPPACPAASRAWSRRTRAPCFDSFRTQSVRVH